MPRALPSRVSGTRHSSATGLLAEQAGTIMVEYVVVLCLVAVGGVLATIALGEVLVRVFLEHQTWLTLPFP